MFPQPCFSDIESFEIVNTEFEEYIGEANKQLSLKYNPLFQLNDYHQFTRIVMNSSHLLVCVG